jgi:acyl-CoA synthetase (AMP-forming)/AMP-acid ligase II
MSHELLDAWQRTLRRDGPRPAVIETATGCVTTFRELDEQAQAWLAVHAESIARLRGRAVVFALPNGAGWLGLFAALLRAGAVAVPLDPGEPVAAQAAIAAAIRAGFFLNGTQLLPLESARLFRERTLCLIKLTSGSTGRPRPLLFTAAQMLADGRQVTQTMGITRCDVNYAIIPLGHSYGLGNLTIPLLAQGVPLVVGSLALPHAIAGDFLRWRPTVLPGVPPVFRGLTLAQIAPASLASLRLAVSAGAPLPPEVAQAFAARFGRRIHSFYGSSETGGISYDRSGAATLAGRSVGRALRGVRLSQMRGQRLGVSSAAVFTRGNRRRAGGLGCWIPPDLATMDARGEVSLLGRRGTVVKIAGRRVNLAEVAARIRRIPGVREVWVGLGKAAEPVLGAALAADVTLAAVKAALRVDTAPWKTPKRWAVLREFPVTARGKPDIRALEAAVFG